jgi:formamidopyrimidine-DNA glycosylase
MPEVVEVALTSYFLNYKMKNKTLNKINILGGRYSRKSLPGLSIFSTELPLTVIKVDSKGKLLWIELENNHYILNTFGLEGEWNTSKNTHSSVEYVFDNFSLYYSDSRNFGTFKITNSKLILDKKLNSINFDFLKTNFTENDFYNRIQNIIMNKNGKINVKKGGTKIIKILMDQTLKGLGSGLGNYLAVDALYVAKISPHTKLITIYNSRSLSNRLSKAIKYIVKKAFITSDIGYLDHSDHHMAKFINKYRNTYDLSSIIHPDITIDLNDKYQFLVYRQKKDPFGNIIKSDKIIKGRTTYWSPVIQIY